MHMEKKNEEPLNKTGVLITAALIFFTVGAFFGYQDKTESQLIVSGTGVFLLIFAYLPYFESFKGLGMEGVLKGKIEEADSLLAQLRKLLLPLADLSLTSAITNGRFGSNITREEMDSYVETISEQLASCGVSQTEIQHTKRSYHLFTAFDMAIPIDKKIAETLLQKQQKVQSEIGQLGSPINPSDQEYVSLNEDRLEIGKEITMLREYRKVSQALSYSDNIKGFIASSKWLDVAEKEALLSDFQEEFLDLDYLKQRGELRRKDVWFAGDLNE